MRRTYLLKSKGPFGLEATVTHDPFTLLHYPEKDLSFCRTTGTKSRLEETWESLREG